MKKNTGNQKEQFPKMAGRRVYICPACGNVNMPDRAFCTCGTNLLTSGQQPVWEYEGKFFNAKGEEVKINTPAGMGTSGGVNISGMPNKAGAENAASGTASMGSGHMGSSNRQTGSKESGGLQTGSGEKTGVFKSFLGKPAGKVIAAAVAAGVLSAAAVSLFSGSSMPASSGREMNTQKQNNAGAQEPLIDEPQDEPLPDFGGKKQEDAPVQQKGEKVLVAEAITEADLQPSGVWVQDLADYCDGAMTYDEYSSGGRKYYGNADDLDIVEAYVKLLEDQDFTLTDTFFQDYKTYFFSYALEYTGTDVSPDSIKMQYKNDVQCNVNVWGMLERDSLEVHVNNVSQLPLEDGGYRYHREKDSLILKGESAMEGLYRLEDGSYETADGRLRAPVGKAVLFLDGTQIAADAEYTVSDSREELWVKNYNRDDSVYMQLSDHAQASGDIWNYRSLMRPAKKVLDNGEFKERNLTLNWGTLYAASHNGAWTTPLYTDSEMEEATVRLMYLTPDYEAVFYLYSKFKTAPYELEGLIAVRLTEEADENAANTVYLSAGDSRELTFDATEFDATHELFLWEILSGDEFIGLDGEISKTCTVHAIKAGSARIRVTYDYGINEPDVLTGIPRTVQRAKTREYVIDIR